MKAAMKTDAPAFWKTEASGSAGKSGRKTESRFLDAFLKVVTGSEKAEKPAAASGSKTETGRKTDADSEQQKKDVSGRTPEETAAAGEESEQAEGQEKTEKEKCQTLDPVFAMMMSAQPDVLADMNQKIQEQEPVFLTEDADAQKLQAAAGPEAELFRTAETWYVPQNGEFSAPITGSEEAGAADSLMDAGPAFEVSGRKETGGQDMIQPSETGRTEAENGIVLQGEPAKTGGETDFSDLMRERREFMSSMNHVGKETADDAGEKSDDGPGLEELKRNAAANGVDVTGRFAASNLNGRFLIQAGAGQTAEAAPVLDQLQASLKQAIKGHQELTVHLKPEGLGDIVIRLAGSDGRVTVNIGVSNSETQKLITSQMMSLKEMLEPLHAEIGEVYHDSQAAMNFLEYGQQMQEQKNRHQPGTYGKPNGHTASREEERILAVAEQMTAESALSRLYAYI